MTRFRALSTFLPISMGIVIVVPPAVIASLQEGKQESSDIYSVCGGSTTLSGYADESGEDDLVWSLKKNDQDIAITNSQIVWESDSTEAIEVNNGKVSWTDQIEEGE